MGLRSVVLAGLAFCLLTGAAVAQPLDKMDEFLIEALDAAGQDEMIPVVALLAPAPDPQALASYLEGFSRTQRKELAWHWLEQRADAAQWELLTWLDREELDGNAERVRGLVLANGIALKAKPALIEELAAEKQVRIVTHDPKRDVLLEEVPESQPFTANELDELAYGVDLIGAPLVWADGYTGEGILVAVIDTGVNYNHQDLADHLWDGGTEYPNHGWDFSNGDNDPMDNNGHGTHCAGTVCGDGTAGNQTGVAPDATLMCINAIGGGGSYAEYWESLDFALEQGADVTSSSLGWQYSWITDAVRSTFRTNFDLINEAGMINIVAAGNEGTWNGAPNNLRTPGTVPSPWAHPDQTLEGGLSGVVTVGATDEFDNIAGFSSIGPVSWENVSPFNDYPYGGGDMGLLKPDVSAPGVEVLSLSNTSNTGYVSQGWSGTSMATPHVAGLVALMLSKFEEQTPAEVDEILQTTALDLGTTGKDNSYGAGRVDAWLAVDAVVSVTGILSGVVTDANTGDPIEGVRIAFEETSRADTTLADGSYSVELPAEEPMTMLVFHPPYADHVGEPVTLADGEELTVDVALNVGEFGVDPVQISLSVEEETSTETQFTVTNTGSWDMDVALSLSPSMEPPEWLGDVFEETIGDILADGSLRGVQYVDGNFYVTGSNNFSNPNYIYRFNEELSEYETFIQPGSDAPDAPNMGMLDLAWDGEYLWGSMDSDIIAMDPETMQEVMRVEGPYNPNRALTYDSDSGYLWVAEAFQDLVAIDPQTGEVMRQYESDLFIYGMDTNPHATDGFRLLLAVRDSASDRSLYAFNPETEEMVHLDHLPDALDRDVIGFTVADGYGLYYVAAVGLLESNQGDLLKGWQMDATVNWAAMTETTFTLAPDEQREVGLTLDAAALPLDTYDVFILAHHNTINPNSAIPLSMEVWSGVAGENGSTLPEVFALNPAYPNPFNPSTRISFDVPRSAHLDLRVYDLLGRQVATLHQGQIAAGRYTQTLDLGGMASGMYFVRMQSEGFSAVQKLMLMK